MCQLANWCSKSMEMHKSSEACHKAAACSGWGSWVVGGTACPWPTLISERLWHPRSIHPHVRPPLSPELQERISFLLLFTERGLKEWPRPAPSRKGRKPHGLLSLRSDTDHTSPTALCWTCTYSQRAMRMFTSLSHFFKLFSHKAGSFNCSGRFSFYFSNGSYFKGSLQYFTKSALTLVWDKYTEFITTLSLDLLPSH